MGGKGWGKASKMVTKKTDEMSKGLSKCVSTEKDNLLTTSFKAKRLMAGRWIKTQLFTSMLIWKEGFREDTTSETKILPANPSPQKPHSTPATASWGGI